MEKVTARDLKKLYIPDKSSHKGMNGKLTIIGGSRLFHGASLWALKVASRIVDMVFYSSIPENNQLTQKLKSEIFDFIAVPRQEVENYINESDAVLIGPGMVRGVRPPTCLPARQVPSPRPSVAKGFAGGTRSASHSSTPGESLRATPGVSLSQILSLENEGKQTYYLTQYLLKKYPNKRWVIDAGSLQMMEPEWLKWLKGNVIITPHKREFKRLFFNSSTSGESLRNTPEVSLPLLLKTQAEKYGCTILLKGPTDIVCSPDKCKMVEGGNSGMTKGGTGDVLAGLVASLYCKNEAFLAAWAASYINKRAGEDLFETSGCFFNASDLADQIPKTMKKILNFKF